MIFTMASKMPTYKLKEEKDLFNANYKQLKNKLKKTLEDGKTYPCS
jgi:predicted component of type VI protein secretion system